jgi:uncharacterized protein YdeI (YjbR/CyaY-like superfamily)
VVDPRRGDGVTPFPRGYVGLVAGARVGDEPATLGVEGPVRETGYHRGDIPTAGSTSWFAGWRAGVDGVLDVYAPGLLTGRRVVIGVPPPIRFGPTAGRQRQQGGQPGIDDLLRFDPCEPAHLPPWPLTGTGGGGRREAPAPGGLIGRCGRACYDVDEGTSMARVPPSASEHPPSWKFGYPVYHPPSREAWRAWLEEHQDDTRGVWVVSWRSSTGRDTVAYDAIVEEALCVGWIDSTVNVLDKERGLQLVTPRKPRSTWARSNKARVARLEAEGRMGPRGRQAVEVAKANGWWDLLDDVEALLEPEDLAASLDAVPAARLAWDGFPPSARKPMLFWVVSAVKDETRRRRIETIVAGAARGERAYG